MHLLCWLLVPCLWSLRLFPDGLQPLRLVQRYGAYPNFPSLMPHVLHSMKLEPKCHLIRLLKHHRLPFDYFYEKGCTIHISRRRLVELLKTIRIHPEWKEWLLSVQCLEQVRFLLKEADWREVLGFEYGLSDPSIETFPFVTSYLRGEALIQATFPSPKVLEPALLNSCRWILHPSTSSLFFVEPFYLMLNGRRDAWMALHHSCFANDKSSDEDGRVGMVLGWLRAEMRVKDLDRIEEAEILRFSLHLLLILQQVPEEHGDALVKHLKSLAEAVRDPLLTQLVLACADQDRVRQQSKRNPLMPNVKTVLARIWEGLETEGQKARWTLDVLELYYRHQPRDLWQDKVIGELFALHLPRTNELQQIHWIKLYLAGPSSTAIEQALISLIEASSTLQSQVLGMEGRRAEVLALVAIGPDRRLKEARRRYLIQPTRCHPFRNIYDMAELVQKYGTHLISTGCIEREGEWDSMVLLTPGRMSTFGHILALASLFDLRPPFTLPPGLTHNLLGFANHWIDCFWTGSMLAELFDRYEIRPDRVVPVSQLRCIDELPVLQYMELSLGSGEEDEEVTVYMGEVVERLERAMAAAHRILLPFITWRQVQLPLYIL